MNYTAVADNTAHRRFQQDVLEVSAREDALQVFLYRFD